MVNNSKDLKEMLKNKDITQLPYYLAKVQSKIYHRTSLGEGNTSKMKQLKWVRNWIRKALLLELIKWYTSKEQKEETSYFDIEEERKLKRMTQTISTKELFEEFIE